MAPTPSRSSSKPAAASEPSGKQPQPSVKPKHKPKTSSAAATPGSSRTSEPAKPRKRIDWEAIERDYRTGKFTLRELEAKHGAGYAKISTKAKELGWSKDLADVVRKATSAALIAEVATARATEGQTKATDVVLAAAELNKQVILQHRQELRATRELAMALLGEVQQAGALVDHKELLTQILAGEGADTVDVSLARQAVRRALETGARVSSVKALAETLTKLHAGERVAFSLNDGGGDEPPPPPDFTAIPPAQRQDAYLRYVSGQR